MQTTTRLRQLASSLARTMPAKTKKPRLEPKPNYEEGLDYWATIPASVDGVLGGFGHVSRIDSLTSRQFLLSLIPRLSKVDSSIRPLAKPSSSAPRTRALDVGAGIGRVTANVLIHLVDAVEVLEPAPHFLNQAVEGSAAWKGLGGTVVDSEKSEVGLKSVRFWKGGLAGFDPANPWRTADELARKGFWPEGGEGTEGKDLKYDVVWCQWCLGHLSTDDLIVFLKTSKAALASSDSVLVVKENLCPDLPADGVKGSVVFDDEDSSLTRSDNAWKYAFEQAGLKLIREELQTGFPDELFDVKMYALQ